MRLGLMIAVDFPSSVSYQDERSREGLVRWAGKITCGDGGIECVLPCNEIILAAPEQTLWHVSSSAAPLMSALAHSA